MPALKFRTTLPKPDDPEILERIAKATKLGHPIATASTLAGIGEATGTQWLAHGVADLEADPDGELSPHARFALAVKAAEAEMVDAKLGVINAATEEAPSKAWVPAMTLLQRRRPQDFSERRELHVSGSVQVEARVVVAELPTEVRALILEAGAEALRQGQKQLPPGDTETAQPEEPERAEP